MFVYTVAILRLRFVYLQQTAKQLNYYLLVLKVI